MNKGEKENYLTYVRTSSKEDINSTVKIKYFWEKGILKRVAAHKVHLFYLCFSSI